ncbi:flagellar type III secretion system pore protein FliP [Gemmatimonas aurantiaca]|uniref:flagellar type III secretion system pore protein FliP n=1 Tax=Gemmatimonas aurantiaca TaxID=173480 RepID=UPI00301C1390
MLIAGLGVVAALAFVLGLGALCLYALRRWGTGALGVRMRVPVEVVQRVPLGPKTGLAVVRVGEKVMALSVGEGGVHPLFELDEADRQRVIATSKVPQPHISSAEASAAFAVASSAAAPVAAAPLSIAAFAPTETAEVPRFLTAPMTTSAGTPNTYAPQSGRQADRDFRAMLGVSLSGATRLAVFAVAMITFAAPVLHAQGAQATGTQPPAVQPAVQPPAVQPPAAPVAPAGAGTQTARPASAAATPALQSPAAPRTLDAPPLVPANRRGGSTRGAAAGARNDITNATAKAQLSTTPTAQPRTGNGAATTNRGTSAPRAMSQMVTTPAQEPNNQASAATPAPIAADDAIMRMMPQMDVKLGGSGEDGGLRLNGTVGIVVMMGLLTLLPTLLLMMTGFTRILIVLHFLKQAMGTQTAPPGQLLAGMALLLTGFVMGPTLSEVNRTAITPWLDGQMTQVEMMKTGVKPFRTFMLKQTRPSDVETFVRLSRMDRPNTVDDVPLHVLMSAFVASELRTAFQIGFAIYLPFIIIDAVVASVLMSMGMFMLPPAMISLPFKLLLFVLVDGWSLTITSLVQSFR